MTYTVTWKTSDNRVHKKNFPSISKAIDYAGDRLDAKEDDVQITTITATTTNGTKIVLL